MEKALKFKCCDSSGELVRFIEEKKIKKEDIQQITDTPLYSYIYYWEVIN